MKCPVCANELKEIKSKSTLVDICPACKGIWFDPGEIANFVRTLAESKDIPPRIPQLFKSRTIKKADTLKEQGKSCPRCHQKLQIFNYACDSNVFLDRCTSCEGIWADGGEARKIAVYLKVDPRVMAIGKDLIHKDEVFEDLKELGNILKKEVHPVMLFMPKIIIPLADDNPRQRVPVVTISIIALCTLIFAIEMLFVSDPRAFFLRFGLVPIHFFSIGLISSVFLHAGFLHFIGNMLFFWIFGDNVEDRFSRFGYLIFFLSCGLAAGILHCAMNANSAVPSIGASGAVSGIMGAYFIFYPRAKVKMLFIYKILNVPAYFYLGGWLLIQLAYAALGVPGIAWFAHIGGFLFGGLVAYVMKTKKLSPTAKPTEVEPR